jgi:hypothetical protein
MRRWVPDPMRFICPEPWDGEALREGLEGIYHCKISRMESVGPGIWEVQFDGVPRPSDTGCWWGPIPVEKGEGGGERIVA